MALIIEISGHALEILGVFLLSVEAIKLENLYKLRDRFLLPMQHNLQPGLIRPNQTKWTKAEFRRDQLLLRHFYLSHYGAGCGIVVIILAIGCYVSRNISFFFVTLFTTRTGLLSAAMILFFLLVPVLIVWTATEREVLIPPIVVMIAMALATFPLGLIPMLLGEAAHQGSRVAVRKILRALEFIAEGTPTGTIGILGFIGVCVGKIIQLLAGSVQH